MKPINFEKALAELEETVSRLESGELSLDDSLEMFEKGVGLAKYLRGELDKAEKKIEILLKDEKGAVKAEPFDAGAEDGTPPKPAGTENEDDVPF